MKRRQLGMPVTLANPADVNRFHIGDTWTFPLGELKSSLLGEMTVVTVDHSRGVVTFSIAGKGDGDDNDDFYAC